MMKFKEGNKYRYLQDFSIWEGIPTDIEFTVKEASNGFKLVGEGHGSHDYDYGNGPLYVFGLTEKQTKKFQKHLDKRSE